MHQHVLFENLNPVIDPQLLISISLILLLALDFITSATRSALLNLKLARLLGQRERNAAQVNHTQEVLNALPRLHASLDITQSLLRFLLAGLALLLYLPWEKTIYPVLYGGGILLLSGMVLFWFEYFVEWYFARSPETWALRLTPFAQVLMTIMTPLLALPMLFSRRPNRAQESAGTVTEDELLSLVDAGQLEGIIEKDERQMIKSIIRLGDTLVREIMVPRVDVLALEINTPLPRAVDIFLQSGHSRVPVYHETIDNIQGLLYAKDLLSLWHENSQLVSLDKLLRPVYYIPETKKIDDLLAEMQAQRIHMGIVVDEYGGVAGLVTLEDIVEEIVGEILDEYDQAEELPFQIINDSEYIFLGRVDLDDFNDIMRCELPKDEADTLGGYIYSRIGRVPTGGENVQFEDLLLTVEQVAGQRIRKVKVQRIAPDNETGAEENNIDR